MQPKLKKVLTLLLCFLLCFEQSGFAQIAGQLDISGHLAGLRNAFVSDVFRPLHLRYLSYNPLENNFQLFLDKGSLKNPNPQELEDTTKTLLNYFFVGVTLPNDTFWVNLRPDAEDQIIDDRLAQTDVGRIMLETDLQLKKDTAKFTSPETPEGREYWDKLYKKAEEIFGSSNITIPTLTRPWIVPDEIIIRETTDSAYIYKATLKVMLEQDYLKDSTVYSFKDERLKELNEYSSQLIRELIIPKLNKEVNSSKRYAQLRQVYYSLIMAQWFKARYYGKDGLYSHLIDRKDLTNLTSKESWSKTTYFKEYQKSFKDGEYNIKEPIYTPYGQTIRTYFSGGIKINTTASINRGFIPTLGGRIKGLLRKSSLIGLIAICLNMPGDVKISVDVRPQETLTIKEDMPEAKKVITRADVEEISIWELFEGTPLSGLDYKWYRISGTSIYYLEFQDYSTQDQALNRLAIFVESKKYAGKILRDAELEEYFVKESTGNKTLGIGHDYTIEKICAFYTKARQEKIPLNLLEEKIKNDLLMKGFMKDENNIYKPLKKIAVISSTPETTTTGGKTLRVETILHEWRHGLFMTEPYIRDKIKELWKNLSDEQRENLTLTIQVLADYNPRDEDLILGELYASLLDFTSPAAGVIFGRDPREQVKVMQRLYEQFNEIEDEWKTRKSQQKQEEIIRDVLKKFLQERGGKEANEDQSRGPSSPSSSPITALGGIDFRYLPIITQAIGNLSANMGSFTINRLNSIDLDTEWREIENMVNSGIIPSAERIKEYVQVSCYKGNADKDIDKVISCISDVLRLEEERCDHTNPTLRDILVVLESMGNTQELREVFLGKAI